MASRQWDPTPLGAPKASTLRPFHGEIQPLLEADKYFFQTKYQLSGASKFIFIDQKTNRYALPIYAPDHSRRGMVLRLPWDGSPLKAQYHTVKADTFIEKIGPVQSHYWCTRCQELGIDPGPIVLVEDQLSAIKLAEHGYDAVAFLGTPTDIVGTYGGMDRVAEITRRMHAEGHTEAVIALDADATEEAFMFVRKWEYAFDNIRVAILSQDIKDTDYKDFPRILGA